MMYIYIGPLDTHVRTATRFRMSVTRVETPYVYEMLRLILLYAMSRIHAHVEIYKSRCARPELEAAALAYLGV